MRNTTLLSIFGAIFILSSASTSLADPFEEYKIRAGTLTVESLEPGITFGAQALLLNKKKLTKGDADILSLSKPVQIGKFDVFALREQCSGSSCPEQGDTRIYLMETNGKYTIAPMFNMQGKPVDSFFCAWDSPPQFPSPKLVKNAWVFQCIEYDGRRTKTTYWTLDNGVVRETRTSSLWGTAK